MEPVLSPTFALAGLTAAGLALVEPVPYVRDILRGHTRPYRVSWLIWSALGVVTFCAQVADGGTWSVVAVGIQTAATILVFALSIGRGEGRVRPTDAALLLLASAGVLAWAVSTATVMATLLVIAVDVLGVVLMLPKTYRDPWSETRSSYVLATASGALSTVAVGAFDLGLALYPAYIACANGVTAVVITVARNRTRAPGRAGTGGSTGPLRAVEGGSAPSQPAPGIGGPGVVGAELHPESMGTLERRRGVGRLARRQQYAPQADQRVGASRCHARLQPVEQGQRLSQ